VTNRLPPDALELWGAAGQERYTRRRRVVVWSCVAGAVLGTLLIVHLLRQREASNIRDIVRQAAMEEGVDPLLAEAVVDAESGGNPRARSRAAAFGLMQLVIPTASELAGRPVTETELYDPRFNARLGCRYLARLMQLYSGDVLFTLMAYNAGMGRVRKWRRLDPDSRVVLKKHAFKETRAYVYKVLRTLKELREQS
jgi:soluble lytic murein transglycosylase